MNKLLVLSCLLVSSVVYAQHNPSNPADFSSATYAPDQYVDTAHYANGDKIPYLLTEYPGAKPKYAVILMPGGNGTIGLQKEADGTIFFNTKGNFLIRSRILFADKETVTVVIDRFSSVDRMRGLIDDLQRRYPGVKIFVAGTSYSTPDTMYLATHIDGEVAGFIHTSAVGSFDSTGLKSKNIVVGHIGDSCKWTNGPGAVTHSKALGTDTIMMDGGDIGGNECSGISHHGFLGIEKETVDKIKEWMKK